MNNRSSVSIIMAHFVVPFCVYLVAMVGIFSLVERFWQPIDWFLIIPLMAMQTGLFLDITFKKLNTPLVYERLIKAIGLGGVFVFMVYVLGQCYSLGQTIVRSLAMVSVMVAYHFFTAWMRKRKNH